MENPSGPIDRVLGKLGSYPGLKYGRMGGRLEVDAPNPGGFPVSFLEGKGEYVLGLGKAHWHFRDADEALEHLAFALSDRCRLREISRGGRPYHWIVEQKAGEGWSPVYETGLLLFRFWRKRTEAVYRNTLIR